MRRSRWSSVLFLAFAFLAASQPLHAASESNSDNQLDITPLPVRYIFVDGEADKFRAHHWKNNNYAAGVEEFYSFYRLPNDITVKMEGKAIPADNDYEGVVIVKKKEVGQIKFDYQEFRKYYDRTGGVYHPFNLTRGDYTLRVGDAVKDLELDIGHFGVEAELDIPDFPKVVIGYEREFKNGAKSRLTWGDVVQSGVTRKIAPSYQDVSEVADTFDLKVNHTVKGYDIKSEQKFEIVKSDNTRVEKYFGADSDATAGNKLIRRQQQKPEAHTFSSIFGIAKWFLKDKIYTSAGYRYAQVHNKEWEDIREFDENGNPRSFANAENRFGNIATNHFHSNTWVASMMAKITKWFNVGTKVKTEFLNRRGESTYNVETTDPPDNRINRFDVSDTRMSGYRWGQGITARFTAIPRTAIYTELELEQDRLPMSENRDSIGGQSAASASEVFIRETITNIQRGVMTVGGHVAPFSFMRLTSHFRRTLKMTDYDDIYETVSSGVSKSAFFDSQHVYVNEFMTRLALTLTKYLQPSFRFVGRDTNYRTNVEALAGVDTETTSNNFIFDFTSQPVENVMILGSYSKLMSNTNTPAAGALRGNNPGFNANVDTWTLSTSYMPRENLSFIQSVQYARADNFNDFTAIGLPIGSDYRKLDLEAGLKWNVNEKVTVEPKYGLYYYLANSNAEFGDYIAHLISCEISLAWG